MLLVTQTEDALDAVLESHRIGLADQLLLQVLAGSGTGNDLAGIAGLTEIGGATYAETDRGDSGPFLDGEDAVEDGGARPQYEAWALGAALSASARRTLLEPGSDRRTEERGRLSLSGLPVQRIGSGLAATTGLICDWQAVTVPVLDQLIVVTDRISSPGDLRITTRLGCSNPILGHPQTAYRLTQA